MGQPLTITDATGADVSGNPAHIANINPLRYRAYYFDAESGLYFLQNRYYDASICRMINADTTAVLTKSIYKCNWDKNLFAYCDNNPLIRIDESGEFWNIIGGAVIGGLIGGGLEVAKQLLSGKSLKTLDWGAVAIETASGAATGALMSAGVPAPALQTGKMLINGATSVAHSIKDGDSLSTTLLKASGSMVATGIADNVKSLHYVPKHAKATPVVTQVVTNRLTRGATRMISPGLAAILKHTQSVGS